MTPKSGRRQTGLLAKDRSFLLFDWIKTVNGNRTEALYHSDSTFGFDFRPDFVQCLYGQMLEADRMQFRKDYSLRLIIGILPIFELPLIEIPNVGGFLSHRTRGPVIAELPTPDGKGVFAPVIPANVRFSFELEGKPFAPFGPLAFAPVLIGARL